MAHMCKCDHCALKLVCANCKALGNDSGWNAVRHPSICSASHTQSNGILVVFFCFYSIGNTNESMYHRQNTDQVFFSRIGQCLKGEFYPFV